VEVQVEVPDDPFEPAKIRATLTECGLFLAAWEMLKQSVVDKLRTFYSFDFKARKFVPGKEYHNEVVVLRKHILDASLQWLVNSGAITADDVAVVHAIREHRNDIAHDLPTYALSWGKRVDSNLLVAARRLVHEIDNFWARAEFEGDPDVPPDTDFTSATSLKAVLLDHMIAVATKKGNDVPPPIVG
jgi:hypothetical protein